MNYSQITENLLIGTTPKGRDYELLHQMGVKLVINMRIGTPPWPDLHTPPMKSLWLPSFDSPFIPIPLSFLSRGAKAALEAIAEGGVVYTHCSKGRHRGAAMAACILIAQGMTVQQAIDLVRKQRPQADPDAWYIRRMIVKFASEWHKGKV